jgi:hypothetical protein
MCNLPISSIVTLVTHPRLIEAAGLGVEAKPIMALGKSHVCMLDAVQVDMR